MSTTGISNLPVPPLFRALRMGSLELMSKDKESLKRLARRKPNALYDWVSKNGGIGREDTEQSAEELEREHENQVKEPEVK